MKILVIDPILFLGPTIVQKLVLDGHEVVYAPIWGPKSDSIFVEMLGRGLGAKVDPEGWMNWLDWADVATVTGSEHRGHIVHFLRKAGVPVCGPGLWGVQLELDREFGHQVFDEAGLNPSKRLTFRDPDKLVDYVEENPGQYVFKLDQTAREISETFVGQDPYGKDLLAHLKDLAPKLHIGGGRVKLYLEEALDGVEIGCGGWFNGDTFVGKLMVTFEVPGGYVYDFRVPVETLMSTDKLKGLEKVLKKARYRGAFDINGFLTEAGEWKPVEWTPRWGAGTTEMFAHSCPDLGELIFACATGKQVPTLKDAERKITVLVNARHDPDEEIREPAAYKILVPDGRMPVIREGCSFWARWPAKIGEDWMSLLVSGGAELRVGVYVGEGNDLDDALGKIKDLSGSVKVAGSYVETARCRENLVPLMNEIQSILADGSEDESVQNRLQGHDRDLYGITTQSR